MTQLEKSNILLVDDRPENLLALESILEDLELNIFTATSGNKALALTLETSFALILLDVQMPDMDGIETARLIRSVEQTRHIPIIFVTAVNKEQEYIFKGYEIGAVDYLFKPVDPDILRSKVKVFLELDQQKKRLEQEIVARKQAEAELKSLARSLAQSNASLEEFTYVASHDLKEPLITIQGLGKNLEKKYASVLDEKGRANLRYMQNAAKRLQTLINDLLMYSRATTAPIDFHKVDLAEIVHSVIDDLKVRIEQAGGSIEVGDLPVVEANEAQMRQLFQNLIGNAIKFHRPGVSPIVRVEAERFVDQQLRENWRLSVSDNGIGFDEKFLDRIFSPFQRLHGASRYEGTGIGLAVCRKVCMRHGGSITGRSAPGSGATFIVTLPAQQAVQGRMNSE